MNNKVGAINGGCWYCGIKDDKLTFCREFDTFIHVKCIKERIRQCYEENIEDEECEIIAAEFGIGA